MLFLYLKNLKMRSIKENKDNQERLKIKNKYSSSLKNKWFKLGAHLEETQETTEQEILNNEFIYLCINNVFYIIWILI